MDLHSFIETNQLHPSSIDGPACLNQLLRQMELGLAGQGNIPMIPSYLPLEIPPAAGEDCCVLDAGGTNLRYARAVFHADGSCTLQGLHKTAMPGTQGELTAQEFYRTLADYAKHTGSAHRVGFCFSYAVEQERNLDGTLLAWCKEVRVPDAPGKPVGASLRQAIGPECESVRVLNDSTAALLGAHSQDSQISLGLILGTGINICYEERCRNIPKVPVDLKKDAMIISTEIGEFQGFPKTPFDDAVITASDEPELAHAEKQCAGAYLGDLISLAWQSAAREGLIAPAFAVPASLPQISDCLAGVEGVFPEDPAAKKLAGTMIHRAAKIAAVLTAGPILRSCPEGTHCAMVIEGSQFHKLTGFAQSFLQELEELLRPYEIRVSIKTVENSCLIGAALAAFAEPM